MAQPLLVAFSCTLQPFCGQVFAKTRVEIEMVGHQAQNTSLDFLHADDLVAGEHVATNAANSIPTKSAQSFHDDCSRKGKFQLSLVGYTFVS